MAKTSIDITLDSKEFRRDLNRISLECKNIVADRIKFEALAYQRDVRLKITSNKSIVSGDMRRSIKIHKENRFYYVVGTNLFYAPYVEYGTRRGNSPKPFMKPVHDSHKDTFIDDLKKLVEGALR